MFVSHIIPFLQSPSTPAYNRCNQVQTSGQLHLFILIFPLYTTIVDLKSKIKMSLKWRLLALIQKL